MWNACMHSTGGATLIEVDEPVGEKWLSQIVTDVWFWILTLHWHCTHNLLSGCRKSKCQGCCWDDKLLEDMDRFSLLFSNIDARWLEWMLDSGLLVLYFSASDGHAKMMGWIGTFTEARDISELAEMVGKPPEWWENIYQCMYVYINTVNFIDSK